MTDQQLNAETAIIGGLLMDPEETEVAYSALTPEDFESAMAASVFRMCLKAHSDRQPVDTALLRTQITDPETQAYILACAESFVSASAYPAYIQAVRNEAQRRRITEKLQGLLFEGADADTLVSELSQTLEAEKSEGRSSMESMSDCLRKYEEDIYKPVDMQGRINTGWSKLDRTLNGLRKGSLSYLGAAPSTGKTTFALNLAKHAIHNRRRVQFFSLEMSREQLLDRLFSNALSLPYTQVDEHTLDAGDKDRLAQAVAKLYGNSDFLIVDDAYALESISHSIAQYRPELAIVDFLQNVRTREKFRDRRNQVDTISAEFKRIARVNNCHVMALSQINRGGEKGSAPRMSDLKESGNLEADGDVILLMHRPFVADKTDAHSPSETAVLVDKNKYGECGKLSFSFNGNFQRFTEVETRYDG